MKDAETLEHVHFSIDDPLQILFAFFGTMWTTFDSPEESWVPLDTFLSPLRRFRTLPVLDLGLFVSRSLMIALLDRIRRLFPQSLRLAIPLFLDRAHQGRARLRSRSVEEHFFVAGLVIGVSRKA